MLTRLHQHLYGDIVGYVPAVNEFAEDFIFRFGSRRKTDFNFFNPNLAEGFEHLQLFIKVHRVDERLIAVPQVDTAPDGMLFDFFRRPLPAAELDCLKRDILFAAWFHHDDHSFHRNLDFG